MNYNPNQGQDPNQQSQYGGYGPPPSQPQPTDPYSGQGGYGQPGYQPPQGAYPPGGYQPPQAGYQQPQGGFQPGGYQQGPQGPYGAPPIGTPGPLGPTSMGMEANVAAGLSYVLGWVTGLVFFLVEKRNRFVRFHAMQSIILFGGISVLYVVLGFAGYIDLLFFPILCLRGLIGLASFVAWIFLLINAFQGKYFKLPIIGDYAERYANQVPPGM